MTLLYTSDPAQGPEWARLIAGKAPDLDFRIWPDIGDPRDIRYLATGVPPADLMARFPNLEVLFAMPTDVDPLDLSALPESLPVVRLAEPGLIDGMVEYVTMSVLALHRDLVPYIAQQRRQHWKALRIQPASAFRVGVLGLGDVGEAVCRKLAGFGFDMAGWSRARRTIEGVVCHAGPEEMPAFLARTDILVSLLPESGETRGMLNAELFEGLPHGAMLVDAGRGDQLDPEALLSALDSGQISAAVLDLTSPEPLPPGHRLWRDPRVLITSHIAGTTEPETAVDAILENLRRHRAGEALLGLADRGRGD